MSHDPLVRIHLTPQNSCYYVKSPTGENFIQCLRYFCHQCGAPSSNYQSQCRFCTKNQPVNKTLMSASKE